ncbi:hypothetical protein DENIS_0066 [Desulfonema ishimotonii]|uniref:Prepilin-type N-terminal cleavage/methylation domain-containing protein n=1 Tax=Desulfonema ishimotonii TaxID=45657 RepID=A0A401FQA1_9BACT|nr:prepilin-type N-terminal cleavage/methylation domain-containing protein [Desulfonema ishimotonii]GBC59130.1 hypothetical protein DENIS_0066 [Desulfonema ishimotonii]
MKHNVPGTGGFTLIEVIVSLLLMGIISAIWGMGIVQIVEGFLFSRQNIETLQKGQITMSRLVKEFQALTEISPDPLPNSSAITFARDSDIPGVRRTIAFDSINGEIKIDEDVLVDQVNFFKLEYYKRFDSETPVSPTTESYSEITIIDIRIGIKGAENTVAEFNNRVFLRGVAG